MRRGSDDVEGQILRLEFELRRVTRRAASLDSGLRARDERIAELDVEVEQARDMGYASAYEDCARRARAVMPLHPDAAVRDALEALARRFSSLAVDSADDARAALDRHFMAFTDAERLRAGGGGR